MGIKNLNPTDRAARQAGFVGNGANDVARFDPIPPAHFHAEALHVALGGTHGPLSPWASVGFAGYAIAAAARIPAQLPQAVAARPVVTYLVEVVFALDQQRLASQADLEGRQGQLLGAAALLLGHPLQDFTEQGPLFFAAGGCLETVGQLAAQPVQTALVDGGVVGHVHRLDRFAHSPLQAAEETPLPRGEKQDRVAFAAGPAGTANPVDIGLRIKGDVVVNDQADAVHIQPPGGHIGGDQDIHLALFEPLDGPLPLGLGHIPIQHGDVVAVLFQRLSHRDRDGLGAGKDDHALTAFGFEHPLEGRQFVRGVHDQMALADAAGIGSFLLDRDLSWRVEIFLRNPADFAGHGG